MLKKSLFLFLGILVFFLFVLFSYLVHKNFFVGIDFDTTVKLQDRIPRKFDELFSLLSITGAIEFSTFVLVVVLALRRRILAFFVLFFYAGFHFLELYGKTFVDHLPPPEFLIRTKKLAQLPQFYVRAEFSYPSGHAARAAFLSIIISLILLKSKKLNNNHKLIIFAFLFVYDLLMFVSRPYLGEHWSTDVIGGIFLGTAFALISAVFL